MSPETIKTGTIKWYSVKKGYGFLVPHEGGDDVFLHCSNVHGYKKNEPYSVDLKENEVVRFELRKDRRGKMQAFSVKRCNEDDQSLYRNAYNALADGERILTDEEADELIYYLPDPDKVDRKDV